MFANPAFDGDSVRGGETVIGSEGESIQTCVGEDTTPDPDDVSDRDRGPQSGDAGGEEEDEYGTRKFYVEDCGVEFLRHLVYELDVERRRLACKHLTDYAGEKGANPVPRRFGDSGGLARCRAPGRDCRTSGTAEGRSRRAGRPSGKSGSGRVRPFLSSGRQRAVANTARAHGDIVLGSACMLRRLRSRPRPAGCSMPSSRSVPNTKAPNSNCPTFSKFRG